MIDDAELHRMWVAGASHAELLRATGRTKHGLAGHIQRLRKREGEARWPRRPSIITKAKPAATKPQRMRGHSTLPPLASLQQP